MRQLTESEKRVVQLMMLRVQDASLTALACPESDDRARLAGRRDRALEQLEELVAVGRRRPWPRQLVQQSKQKLLELERETVRVRERWELE